MKTDKLVSKFAEMERQDALGLLELLSRLGGSAITYSRRYHPGSVTIGSGKELGSYIVGVMEGSPLINVVTSISRQLRAQLSRENAHVPGMPR